MAVSGTTAILLGLGILGTTAATMYGARQQRRAMRPPMEMPKPPDPKEAARRAEEALRTRRRRSYQSIYTSPLGVGGEAQIARKTLLGQ